MIPNIFHFVYGLKKQKEPFHLIHYICIESCLQVNEPEEIFLYYHYEPYGKYWDLIKDKITTVHVELSPTISKFRYHHENKGCKKYNYAHHSDFIRLEKLLEHGGVYADIDTIFVNKISPKLFSKPFVLGREDDIICQRTGQRKRSLCNALIMSPRDADFGRKWLTMMEQTFDGSWSNHSTLLPQSLSEKYPQLIHVENNNTFYKYMWTSEDLYTLFEGCNTNTTDIASIHLWSHLWWSRWRRDFSRFHGKKLSESFINNVDTTYNLLARKYLPKQNNKHCFFPFLQKKDPS